mgnify:CR=1 FL=1
MKSFIHYQPVKSIFGAGSLNSLPDYLKETRKIVIVTGKKSAKNTGLINRLNRILNSSSVEEVKFIPVGSNPTISEVEFIAESARKIRADLIIGIGGGSAMDAAKAGAIVGAGCSDFKSLIGKKIFNPPPLPSILIPTTAGTGSEVNQYAIITDEGLNDKLNLNGANSYPMAAILDPELSVSMPEEITIDTGLDAFCHAVEGYIARRSVPISDTLAAPVFELVNEALPVAVREGNNLEARGKMLYAASLAGMVISHTGTTMVHAMGYPLTLRYGVSHGRANAAIIAHGLRFNYEHSPARISRIYEIFGGSKSANGNEAILNFIHSLGVKTRLRDYSVERDYLAEYAKYVIGRSATQNSPAEVNYDNLKQFLEDIY